MEKKKKESLCCSLKRVLSFPGGISEVIWRRYVGFKCVVSPVDFNTADVTLWHRRFTDSSFFKVLCQTQGSLDYELKSSNAKHKMSAWINTSKRNKSDKTVKNHIKAMEEPNKKKRSNKRL